MKKKRYFFPLALFLSIVSVQSNAQEHPLGQREVDRLLNTAFSSLVTSSTNYGEIGTYASVDPVNAAFTLKGSFPFSTGRQKNEKKPVLERLSEDEGRFSYLSFSLSGNLIDKSYAKLFFGTHHSMRESMHRHSIILRLAGPNSIFFLMMREWEDIALRRDLLKSAYQRDYLNNEMIYSDSFFILNQSLLQQQAGTARKRLSQKLAIRDLLSIVLDTLDQSDPQFPVLTDSMAAIKTMIDGLRIHIG